jgi:hypothetical protein
MGISLGVKIWGDIGPLLTELAKAEKSLNKFSRSAEKMGKELFTGLTLPIVGFGVLAVKNFAESENAAASLSAQIRANGKDVDATMAKYKAFAEEMQNLTTYEDDAVIGFLQLAESMQSPNAEQATKDAIGLSKAFGVEMTAAIKMAVQAQNGQFTMLGKLNPAIRAAKTESEKAAIAHKMFADSFTVAAAQAKVGLGPLEQLKNQIGNMSEEFGRIITSYITPFVAKLKEWMTWLNTLSEGTKKTIVNVALFAASIGPLLLAVGKISGVMGSFSGIMKTVLMAISANPWLALAAAISAAGSALLAWQLARAAKPLDDLAAKNAKEIAQEKAAILDYVAADKQGRGQILDGLRKQIAAYQEKWKAEKQANDTSGMEYYALQVAKINILVEDMKAAVTNASSAVVTGFGEQGKAIDKAKQELAEYNKMLMLGGGAITYGEFGGSKINRMPSVSKPTGTMTPIPNPKPGVGNTDNSALDNLELMNEALDRVKMATNGMGGVFSNVFSSIADVVVKAASKVKQSWQESFAGIANVVSSVVGMISSIMSAGTEKKLQENENYYQTEKDAIENSYMTQDQKTKALEKLDKNYEKKRKELMREQAKDAKTTAIMQAIVQGALAVVTALSAGPVIGEVLAVLVAGLVAAQIATIASQPLPALAEGGLASAPTMAMVGDNPNARIDPEVISPLSKLKGMLSTAGEMILSARVSGDDLLFITERANKRRSFTRGY